MKWISLAVVFVWQNHIHAHRNSCLYRSSVYWHCQSVFKCETLRFCVTFTIFISFDLLRIIFVYSSDKCVIFTIHQTNDITMKWSRSKETHTHTHTEIENEFGSAFDDCSPHQLYWLRQNVLATISCYLMMKITRDLSTFKCSIRLMVSPFAKLRWNFMQFDWISVIENGSFCRIANECEWIRIV